MKHTKKVLVHRTGYKPFYREQLVGTNKAKEYIERAKQKILDVQKNKEKVSKYLNDKKK